jgi:hypothetical protein
MFLDLFNNAVSFITYNVESKNVRMMISGELIRNVCEVKFKSY